MTRAGRVTHSVRLRSGCIKQILSIDGSRRRDLLFPHVPFVPIPRGRTVIFKSVAGQFAAVKYRSETYCLDSMTWTSWCRTTRLLPYSAWGQTSLQFRHVSNSFLHVIRHCLELGHVQPFLLPPLLELNKDWIRHRSRFWQPSHVPCIRNWTHIGENKPQFLDKFLSLNLTES
jgi:hypothetical protein